VVKWPARQEDADSAEALRQEEEALLRLLQRKLEQAVA